MALIVRMLAHTRSPHSCTPPPPRYWGPSRCARVLLVEWLVHGKLMHRRSRWPLVHLAYDLHHRAHHWIHYPPGAYVQDE